MTCTAVMPLPCEPAPQAQEFLQESPVVEAVALALAAGLYVLAAGILVGSIMGWHSLPFGTPQAARAYYGLALEDVLSPQLAHITPIAQQSP